LGGASIYILLCSDGSYYTGITRRSVEERVNEHPGYTFARRPVKLVFSEQYERIVDAIAAERRIKGWSRAKKEAYMRGDFSALVALAKRGPKEGVWVGRPNRRRPLERPFEAASRRLRTREPAFGSGSNDALWGADPCGP